MKATLRYDDRELVAAVKDPKQLDQAIQFLYQQHAQPVSSFIMTKGGNPDDAKDIFQDTVVAFIDTVQKGKYRGESSVRTFLIAISKNLWYNEIRKRRRADNREKLYEVGKEETEADVSEQIANRELNVQFRDLLGTLGESCQTILKLFYYEDLSMKEIVSHLHYENEQVVRNKKYKCLQQLTGLMKANPAIANQISELINRN